jgi:hypothetical protein
MRKKSKENCLLIKTDHDVKIHKLSQDNQISQENLNISQENLNVCMDKGNNSEKIHA